jgi:tRNA(fMet)-specific endonuclease VapC
MKYMLDTNTCIYLLKHDHKVLSAFAERKNEGVSISAIVLAELEFGICNSAAQEKNRRSLIAFLPMVSVIPFDGTAAAAYGVICAALRRNGKPIGPMDTLIAAHAKANDLILVTNNTREFERVEGLQIENWV